MLDSLPQIATAVDEIRQARLKPLELVEHCLGQIDRFEPTVQAWVSVDADGARREAERLGRLAREGQIVGPLHGIPIGIKDIIDIAGLPTRAGSKLLGGHVAEADAEVVRRLRAAGAILLGKTVTTEFACFDPPPTKNPWNLSRTPGGSSSGSAVAPALEMCLAAIGSQTGGSITRPASFCGVAGLKPTHGRLSTDGVVPLSGRLDHLGPLARTAGDLAAVYFALVAGESGESFEPLAAPPRIDVIETFFMDAADDEVRAVTRAALDRLAAAGAAIGRCELPPTFDAVHAMHRCIMAVEAAETHCETFVKHAASYGPKVAELIQEGLNTFAVEYALALRHHDRYRDDLRRLFADGRIAVTPATVTPAPDASTTGDPRFNSPWSYAGLPTVSIPCGLSAGGLPCSLQFIGPAGSEGRLLSLAAWCEPILDFPQGNAIASCPSAPRDREAAS